MLGMNRGGYTRKIDLVTFSLYLGLVGIGWLMVFTVGYGEGYAGNIFDFFGAQAGKQTIWVGISFFVFAFIMLFDWKFWSTFAYPIYGIAVFFLVAVLIFGTKTKGATAWFSFGGFSFQPSELAKFATALAMSSFLSHYSTNLKTLKSQMLAFGILLLPMSLIMLQPDAGSTLVFLSFFIVLYREGLSPNLYIIGITSAVLLILGLIIDPTYIAQVLIFIGATFLFLQFKPQLYWGAGAIALAAAMIYLSRHESGYEALGLAVLSFIAAGVALVRKRKTRMVSILATAVILGIGISFAANYAFNSVLKPHQQDRINVWLRPELCDERGSLYNVTQSKMAISSGGLKGKGFLNGSMTKLNYVPEQSTDFIFCTIGEEQGFVGAFGTIILFLLLLIRITIIAERQRSNFSRHYAYCIGGIFFIHFFVNIGMTMGLLPIIGIPLPFISKGGSALLGFTAMIAVLIKLDSHRYQI
ncbi:MAG: rod shape-determining protein RodA [Saprospiraceae bacterium]|jgi:rod shape determining protein RodA|nr:rod shape-determining protein RodA [Saprospiraceae bacterium]